MKTSVLQARMFLVAVMMTPAALNRELKTLEFTLENDDFWCLTIESTTRDGSIFTTAGAELLTTYLKERGVWELVTLPTAAAL